MNISPFDLEYELNPVIYAHLRRFYPMPTISPATSTDATRQPGLHLRDTFVHSVSPLVLNSTPPAFREDSSERHLSASTTISNSRSSPRSPYFESNTFNSQSFDNGNSPKSGPNGINPPYSPSNSVASNSNNSSPASSNTPSSTDSSNTSLGSSNTPNPTSDPSQQFTCLHCSQTFPQVYMLNKHIHRIRTKRFKCPAPNCPSNPFGLRADLERHMRAAHQPIRVEALVYCTVPGCGKTFGRKDNMLKHRRRVHPQRTVGG
ncbi:hypothetical protein CC78DRAFT_615374 [Lojkania enalia]|uniref:C2H2-type domain-containing protein n=1 Tax=Lojkania enalia TaxID=147567 RepID=A0A9P4N4R1_9PLEO|nr:hypothetical protein CC78DRAFT_615374 [Didymosphaeria enalia]